MQEEPPGHSSVKPPPDLFYVWMVARDRALRWKIYEVDAYEIGDKVKDAVERVRLHKPRFLSDEEAVRRFVEKAVRFHVLNLDRHAKRQVPLDEVPERELIATGPGLPEREKDPDPRVTYIEGIVETMPKRWREVWALMIEEFKPRHIAPVLGISVRTASKYVEHVNRRMDEARVEWERLHPKETES